MRLFVNSLLSLRAAATVLSLLAVAACSQPDPSVEVFDPYENGNRQVHAFNKGVDRVVLRPVSRAYGGVLPRPVRRVVSNFANNLELPGDVINDILQLEVEDTVHNTFRFVINTTFGIGGLLDPATSIGLEHRETGFGETLYNWGSAEGAYVELPFFGPSTEREAVGLVADFVTNPLSYMLDGGATNAAIGVRAADVVNTRFEFSDTVDEVLYQSEDSYSSSRSLYLQNLRFRYNGATVDETTTDIFDEIYGE